MVSTTYFTFQCKYYTLHVFHIRALKKVTYIGCPNNSARFKVRAIVVLLGWWHWNFNICHLSC